MKREEILFRGSISMNWYFLSFIGFALSSGGYRERQKLKSPLSCNKGGSGLTSPASEPQI